MSTTEEDSTLADLQLTASSGDVRLPEEKRAVKKDSRLTVKLKGEAFTVAEEIGAMVLMEWAAAADAPVGSSKGLAAIYHILESTVQEDEFNAFTQHARQTKASPDELLDFLNAAMEAIAGRPTVAHGTSSRGSSRTSEESTELFSSARAKGSKR